MKHNRAQPQAIHLIAHLGLDLNRFKTMGLIVLVLCSKLLVARRLIKHVFKLAMA